jgi:basic amino acid/polyamine antiporter, APA family
MSAVNTTSTRRPTLTLTDAILLVVGIVIGEGIFKSSSIVAANTTSEWMFLLAWPIGGLISFIGALCYAELATTYPHAGGEYHYLTRAFGTDIAFLFAWGRLTVIQTGAIAGIAFVFGDYATQIFPLTGNAQISGAIYAAAVIAFMTVLNVTGAQAGKWTQNILTTAKILGLLAVIAAGLFFATQGATNEIAPASSVSSPPAFGLAMIFVLFTFGGWNEGVYVSAEVEAARRNMSRALLWSIALITLIYFVVNVAYLKALGLANIASSNAVGADLMRSTVGANGARFISLLVCVAALGTLNGTIFTGARTNYAWGRDFDLLNFLGRWNEGRATPINALIAQAIIAIALIVYGSQRVGGGFQNVVAYTAPVFWFFMLLVGLSLFVLRAKEPEAARPFTVPLYPLTPLAFCATCIYLLQSSLSYAGTGALAGLLVLVAGVPVLLVANRRRQRPDSSSE